MKKIIACLFAVSVISTAAFSKNFFSQRFFEIKTGTDVGFSNNLFAGNEFFQKDLVIDLRKIANECPDNGFNIRANAQPFVALNVNVRDIHVGVSSGIELYESLSVGKDLFDFLGYGNQIGEKLDFNFTNDADVFAYSKVDVGFRLGKLKLNVQPSVFLPLISIRGGGGRATVENTADGDVNINVLMDMDVYSPVQLNTDDDNNVGVNQDTITDALRYGYGFDIAGGASWAFTKSFSVGATCRIPLIPGHLQYRSNIKGGFDYNMKLSDYENSEKTERKTTVTNTEEDLAIHRPLKLGVYADKNLLGTLFNVHAGAGFGIKRPFSDVAVFYPEYDLGLTFNLIDIFKVGVSTQYKDQIFIHQLTTTLNVRVFQIDVGVSTQSADFKKSMAVAGVGAYACVSVGF